jgi:hypothetical protein
VAGHFDSIGFTVDDEAELAPFVKRALAEGDQIEVLGADPGWGGRYICWDAGHGVQLWLGVDEQGNLSSVDPHYAGRGRAYITLERSYDYDQAPPAGGVFAYVSVGTSEETKAGFDLPAFARFYDMGCDYDGNAVVQVCAFCHGGEVFDNAEAYFTAQSETEAEEAAMSFDVESFLPIGLFDEEGKIPPATARVSGRILEVQRVRNPMTDQPFWAVLVKTVGMTIDVVADDEQLTGEPQVGGVLVGSVYLSALPVDGPKRPPSQADTIRLREDNDAPAPASKGPKITITKIEDEPINS